jgi:segregation and condensation protein A
MEEIKYRLESFEGPLDLLLTLIQKNKVSIYDIPIVEITDQYLKAIENIEESALDNTGEFIVMAAQLLYIKSKMLLPKPPAEEEEDPREELAQRLAEYQKFKEASIELRKSEFSSKYLVFRQEEKIKFPVPEYDRHHDVQALIDAFNSIMQRRIRKQEPQKRAFSGIVGREKVSVDDMVEKICKRIYRKKRLNFKSLFMPQDSRPEMIATFLAVLEMIKGSKLYASYSDEAGDFILTTAAPPMGESNE